MLKYHTESMFVAYDINDNRIYADDGVRHKECFCPVCGESLIHRLGKKRRPHFAHQKRADCAMNLNKDYNNEWHYRMQSYFPKEIREYRFRDVNTGEVHIADVYDPNTNTVIEIQHSPINEEEYLSRTYFHLNNGRRIVWIFDESTDNSMSGYRGRLKPDKNCAPRRLFNGVSLYWIYEDLSFKWLYSPRSFLSSGPNIKDSGDRYRVFVFTGERRDTIQRIISEYEGFKYVVLSVEYVEMAESMDVDQFFTKETMLLNRSPWKEKIELIKARHEDYVPKMKPSLKRKKETSGQRVKKYNAMAYHNMTKEEDEITSRKIHELIRKKE